MSTLIIEANCQDARTDLYGPLVRYANEYIAVCDCKYNTVTDTSNIKVTQSLTSAQLSAIAKIVDELRQVWTSSQKKKPTNEAPNDLTGRKFSGQPVPYAMVQSLTRAKTSVALYLSLYNCRYAQQQYFTVEIASDPEFHAIHELINQAYHRLKMPVVK